MSYFRQFKQFNPLEDRPPDAPITALPEIASRARQLLHDRSLAQIITIAEIIDWIIDNAVEDASDHKEETHWVPERSDQSDAKWLEKRIEYYDLDFDISPDVPHGKDYECFAVLALWKVADALLALFPDAGDGSQWSTLRIIDGERSLAELADASNSALEAMDAVCKAECRWEAACLRAADSLVKKWNIDDDKPPEKSAIDIEEQVRQKISIQARKAAIHKHANDYAMRARAIELYKKRNYPSVEAAAQAIAPHVFKSPRTVARWLYDERKGRTPPPPGVVD